jgi:hypothetical protein
MRTRHSSIRISPIKAAVLGGGLLALTAGLAASPVSAAPVDALKPADLAPGITLVAPPTTRATTTTTGRIIVHPDICRIAPDLCQPPVDPCTGQPTRQPLPQAELERELTIRTLAPRTTTTKKCPTTTTRPDTHVPGGVIVDPPVHIRPTFTG